jgi:glucuronyl/N-acetylglucosaminyl transferase EXT1
MRSPTRCLSVILTSLLLLILIYLFIGRLESERKATKQTRWHLTREINDLSNRDLTDHNSVERIHFETSAEVGINASQVAKTRNKLHLIETLAFPSRLAEFNFDVCDMSTCFDLTLCNASDTLRVHIVANARKDQNDLSDIPGESNIIHERILRIIRQSKYYEPDPKKACLFVPEDDTLDRDPLSTSFRQSSIDIFKPEHRFGMNYLIFNLYSGTWPDYKENDFSGLKIGAAILAKASNSLIYHRDKFDISIPLFSYLHPETDRDTGDGAENGTRNGSEDIDYRNKTYFLTFKGKRYVIGSGSETRNSLYHLNNNRDVIMLTTCRHGKKWRETNDLRCDEDDNNYDHYDFGELMKTSTFCLTPRGRRLGSFRFLEALNTTCIPVVLGDGWVWPFGELIDWATAAIQFPESDIFLVPDTLRDLDVFEIKSMQTHCRALYHKYFASIRKIVMTTLEIIERRIKNTTLQSTSPKT